MLEFWIDPASPYHKPALATEKTLVLFCASAWRSALSVKALQDMGVDNIAEMEGGFGGWIKAGGPVEKEVS
jgi:rhodanese-related sulfurtransferase